jgi:hypothetical protein
MLSKMFQLIQSNNAKLENILKKQDSLEMKFNAQDDKINEILSKFEYGVDKERGKGKGKEKRSRNEFYQVNIYFIIVYFVYSIFTQLST